MGRPPLDVKRTKTRNLRLTDAEDAELIRAAGGRDVAKWIREAALEKARR